MINKAQALIEDSKNSQNDTVNKISVSVIGTELDMRLGSGWQFTRIFKNNSAKTADL